MKVNLKVKADYKSEEYERLKKVSIIYFLIGSEFKKLKLQFTRIKKELPNQTKQDENPWKLHAEIHFYVVTASNLKAAFEEVRKLNKQDNELNTLNIKFKTDLKEASKIRNDLEHIYEGRLEGKRKIGKDLEELDDPNSLGSLFGWNYDFGGRTLNIKDFQKKMDEFKEELNNWNKKKYKLPDL